MTLALNSGSTDAEQTVTRSVTVTVQPHTDGLPEIFPVFSRACGGR